MPVFDKQSWIWDRFVGFITSNDGEIVDRLRFRLYDIERIYVEFFDDVERTQRLAPKTSNVWPETYLSYFAVVVSIQKYGTLNGSKTQYFYIKIQNVSIKNPNDTFRIFML